MISTINGVYDILGWSSPVTITAKLIFSEVCLLKLHWDEKVPNEIKRKWEMWVNNLRRAPTITVGRSICKSSHQTHFEVHGFSDASKVAVCASMYAVTYQDSMPPTCSQIKDRSKRDEHPKTRVGCSTHLNKTPKQREKGVEVLSHL